MSSSSANVNPDLRLPDFSGSASPTGDLRDFMRRMFYFALAPAYQKQLYAITTIIGVLIVLGAAVILVRIHEGNLWIVRVQEAAGSRHSLIIPNSVLSFVLIEAVFGIIYLAYLWCQSSAFEHGSGISGQGYWFTTTWILLFWGAWAGAVGTFYASPGILARRRRVSKLLDIARLIPTPGVCNAISLGVPLLNTISTLTISIFLGNSFRRGVHAWQRFDASQRAIQDANFSAQLTSEQTQAALELWTQWLDTWKWFRLGFLVWGCWAFLLLIFYVPSGGNLVWTLLAQLDEQKNMHQGLEASIARAGEAGRRAQNAATAAAKLAGNRPVWRRQDTDGGDSGSILRNGMSAQDIESAQQEARRAAESTFYPPLKGTVRTEIHSSEPPKYRVLKGAFVNIVLMWSSISSAVLAYGVLCFWISKASYGAAVEGPGALTRFYELYNAIAGWLACGFGGLNFVWVTSRTFEPMLDGLQLKHGSDRQNHLQTISTFFTSGRASRAAVRRKRGGRGRHSELDMSLENITGVRTDVLSDIEELASGDVHEADPHDEDLGEQQQHRDRDEGGHIPGTPQSTLRNLDSAPEKAPGEQQSSGGQSYTEHGQQSPQVREPTYPRAAKRKDSRGTTSPPSSYFGGTNVTSPASDLHSTASSSPVTPRGELPPVRHTSRSSSRGEEARTPPTINISPSPSLSRQRTRGDSRHYSPEQLFRQHHPWASAKRRTSEGEEAGREDIAPSSDATHSTEVQPDEHVGRRSPGESSKSGRKRSHKGAAPGYDPMATFHRDDDIDN